MDIFDNLNGCYGAHCGLFDLYPEYMAALTLAIENNEDFSTGWYGSKKEIASARITRNRDGGNYLYLVDVSVSDDMDTEGLGRAEFTFAEDDEDPEKILPAIETAIATAWENAYRDIAENALYIGFSIGRANREGKLLNWEHTFIAPAQDGYFPEYPPGDCYEKWGWDSEDENGPSDIPTEVKRAMENWIAENIGDNFCVGGWAIRRWER